MFSKDCTSSIIAFINSLLRLNKDKEHKGLMKEAVTELKTRAPLVAKCYDCIEN